MTGTRASRLWRYWVFDLDGTLTEPVHDFDLIRTELGIPHDKLILEFLASLPEAARRRRLAQLDALERALVAQTRARAGARALLARLARDDYLLGILTRNARANALATLEHLDLLDYFNAEHVLGRDEAPPKPDPNGIRQLLRRWTGVPGAAVIVGDSRLDLETGRNAGVATIHLDAAGEFEWPALADVRIRSLAELD